MMFIKKIKKVLEGVKSYGSNAGGCGDSYGNGPNRGGAAGNYTNNQPQPSNSK